MREGSIRNPNERDCWMDPVGSSQPPQIYNGVEVTCTIGNLQTLPTRLGFDSGLK